MSTEEQNRLEFIDPIEEGKRKKLKHLLVMWKAAEESGPDYVAEDELSDARRELQKEVMDTLSYGGHTLEIRILKDDFYKYVNTADSYPNNFRVESDGSVLVSFEGGIQFNDWSRVRQKCLLICLDWNEGIRLVFDDLNESPKNIAEIPRDAVVAMRWKRKTDLDVGGLEEKTGVAVDENSFLNVCDIAVEQGADIEMVDYTGKKWILIKVSTRKAAWEIVAEEIGGSKRRETYSWLDFEAREPKVRLVRESEEGV